MLDEKKYRDICRRLAQRDPKCISDIYDAYADALYGVISRIVKDEGVAADILQETFTKIWEKGDTYNPRAGRLFTWIMRIARNNSLNYLSSKQAKKSQKIQSDENLVYLNDASRAAGQIESFDVKGVLLQLENKYSKVIQLIYFEGYTQQEVSDHLNLPLGTVKSRVKIGLRELKKIYEYKFSNILVSSILIISMFN